MKSQTTAPRSMNMNPIQAVLDNLRLVLGTIFVGISAVILYAVLTYQPYYTAQATLLFEPKIPELLYNNNDRYLHSFEDWMRTQAHEIESRQVLEQAIQTYHDSGFVWTYPGESPKTGIDRLRGRLDISQINNTQIITIELGSRQREGLAELINNVTVEYISHKDRQRKEQDQKKLNYLREEKAKYNIRLEEAYQDLMDISKSYGTAIADEKNLYIYLDMFMDLRSRYNEILTHRIETENKLSALRNQRERLKELNIYDLQNTQVLLEMEQEINARMVGLKPESQLFIDYSQTLEKISTQNIAAARKYLIADIDREINEQAMLNEAAKATEKDLEREMKKAQYELMDINTAVLKTSTQRQAIDRIINIWDRINSRIEQIEIELFNPGRIRVLSEAQTPDFADPSKLMKKVVLGIIAILGLAVGLALGKELLDKRIKRLADIEKITGLSATGYLMDGITENIPPEHMNAIYRYHPNSYMAELFNQLTVRFEKEHHEHSAQVFSFFSLKGKSGASSVAENILAMLDADKNEKILVDLNPGSTEDHTLSNDSLISWLATHRNLDQGIVSSIDAYYDVLHLGSLREMSIARIRPSAVQELLKRLKKRYKYIFIDGLPLLITSESQTIAQESDVSTLVLDAQKDTWPELQRALGILDKLRIPVISMILNKVKVMRAGYFNKILSNHTLRQNVTPLQTLEVQNKEEKLAA